MTIRMTVHTRTTPCDSFAELHHEFWSGIHSMFPGDVPSGYPMKKQKLGILPATSTDPIVCQKELQLQKELDEEKVAHENTKSQLEEKTKEHDFEKKRKDDQRDEYRCYPKCPRR